MIQSNIDKEMKVSDTWNVIPYYMCRDCLQPARQHPQTNLIWGCLKCGYTTAAVYQFFVRKDLS